ncbi:MAG TPA: DUF4436 family protein [Pyrinomonadaceae bacterium]|jgi:hypothetical protein
MAVSKPATKDILIGVGLLVAFVVAMLLVLNIYRQEGEKRSAAISEEGEKDPDHIEAFVKLMTVDPVKGDATARVEFIPHGAFEKEGGTLARNVKLYVNSATGKQEHDFPKGKRMNPVEVVINMYDGLVTDYPFDHHSAFLELYLTTPATAAAAAPPASSSSQSSGETPAPASGEAPAPAATPTSTETAAQPAATPKKEEAAKPGEEEAVPVAVDFYGSIPGMKIEAAKNPDSDDDYVGIDMKIGRSATVIFFSLFITFLMWGATIVVVLLVLSVILRGRKIEVGMFSFLSALLFALVAVRNSQPGVPPIGVFSDFTSFFWAEVILALCLLTLVFTWLLRPAAK